MRRVVHIKKILSSGNLLLRGKENSLFRMKRWREFGLKLQSDDFRVDCIKATGLNKDSFRYEVNPSIFSLTKINKSPKLSEIKLNQGIIGS